MRGADVSAVTLLGEGEETQWSLLLYSLMIIVREGLASLNEAEEEEEDLLDRAWGLTPQSRLSCQAIVAQKDLTVEIPKYSINHAKENH